MGTPRVFLTAGGCGDSRIVCFSQSPESWVSGNSLSAEIGR